MKTQYVFPQEVTQSPNYKLVETGVDTGIFTGYVILTGDPNLKGTTGVDGAGLEPTGSGQQQGMVSSVQQTDSYHLKNRTVYQYRLNSQEIKQLLVQHSSDGTLVKSSG